MTNDYLWNNRLQDLTEPERLAKTFGNTDRRKLKSMTKIREFTCESTT